MLPRAERPFPGGWHRGTPVLDHPELAALGRELRRRMDETLEAEQSAARAAWRRRRTIRDLLLDLEDRAAAAVVWTTDGCCRRGTVRVVGLDHAELEGEGGPQVISLAHVVALEAAR